MKAFFSADNPAFYIVNGLSVLCTLSVVMVSLWMWKVGKIRRASLMLHAAVSFVDLLRHLRLFFNTSNNSVTCTAIAAFSFFGDHLSMLFNLAIAANLHQIYLLEKKPHSSWKQMLWLLPIMVALLIDLLPLIMGVYGKSPSGICFLDPNHKYRKSFKIFLIYATLYVGIIYCLLVSVAVQIKAFLQPSSDFDSRGLAFGKYDVIVRRFATRIALYPLACFISHVGFMSFTIYYDLSGEISFTLSSFGLFLQSITGIINLTLLCLDPSFINYFFSKRGSSFFKACYNKPEQQKSYTDPIEPWVYELEPDDDLELNRLLDHF